MSGLSAPIQVADIELAQKLPISNEVFASGETSARLVVRLHGHTLGILDVSAQELRERQIGDIIWNALHAQVRRHFEKWHHERVDAIAVDGFGTADETECSWWSAAKLPPRTATIVINSCAASDSLARTVTSALEQDYPEGPILVVDNRPASSGIKPFLQDRFGHSRVEYVPAPVPGLGRARNAGLRAARTEIVAFTDDDVVLDAAWLGWLVAGFDAAERVACVTGLIVPLELQTPAQLFLDDFSGFGKGFDLRIWDRKEHRLDHPLYPYTVGLFGSGASAAFKRHALLEMGGFDPHLGIGTHAIGGEDIDIYTRLVLGGHRVVYQPASLLRHRHRREMSSVGRQIHGYGAGLTAMLTKHVFASAPTRRAVLRRIPAGLRYAVSPRSPKNARRPAGFDLRFSLLELAGMAYGPIGYLRSRLEG